VYHGRGFPIALGAVAITTSHQVLRSNSGQFFHSPQVLEGIGIGAPGVVNISIIKTSCAVFDLPILSAEFSTRDSANCGSYPHAWISLRITLPCSGAGDNTLVTIITEG
jgi:hypothetical protein